MTGIVQSALPPDLAQPRPLPGMAPLDMADWLRVDEVFAAQMARRAHLLAERRGDVLSVTAGAEPAAQELLQVVLDWLAAFGQGYGVSGEVVTRPDGVRVAIDRADPMGTLGHLVQEDLCLMERRGGEHVLSAAVLCFPASWRLADKIGRPLSAIHGPVPEYDAGLARRVQRLFDGVRPERPMWRSNRLFYADAELHQPVPRAGSAARDPRFLRVERQCVLRLPQTRACVFSIHSHVVALGH